MKQPSTHSCLVSHIFDIPHIDPGKLAVQSVVLSISQAKHFALTQTQLLPEPCFQDFGFDGVIDLCRVLVDWVEVFG